MGGRELLAGGFHHVRPARKVGEQVAAGGVAHVQRLRQAVVEVERQPALVHLPQQAADARMRELHVVDRVVERLAARQVDRSEEHTSELKSLLRITYAVFCLKKK